MMASRCAGVTRLLSRANTASTLAQNLWRCAVSLASAMPPKYATWRCAGLPLTRAASTRMALLARLRFCQRTYMRSVYNVLNAFASVYTTSSYKHLRANFAPINARPPALRLAAGAVTTRPPPGSGRPRPTHPMQPPPIYGILRLRGHGNATAGIYSVAHTAPAQPDAAAAIASA